MDVCIKNVDESAWREIKVESAKHDLRLGDFLSKLIAEHKENCSQSSLASLMHGEKTLTDTDAKNIRKTMIEFRKDFKFR